MALLDAQKDINRVLDSEVRQLMAQLEDLNQRYAWQGRRSAELAEQLEAAGSSDFRALRTQLARAKQENADLEAVREEGVRVRRRLVTKTLQLISVDCTLRVGRVGLGCRSFRMKTVPTS